MSCQLDWYLPLRLDALSCHAIPTAGLWMKKGRGSGDPSLIHHHGCAADTSWAALFPGMPFDLSSLLLTYVSVDSLFLGYRCVLEHLQRTIHRVSGYLASGATDLSWADWAEFRSWDGGCCGNGHIPAKSWTPNTDPPASFLNHKLYV